MDEKNKPKLRVVTDKSTEQKSKPVYSQGPFDPAHPIVTQSWLLLQEACAFAAFKRYIEGVQEEPNVHAAIGSAVDAGITFGLKTVIRTGRDAGLAEKTDAAGEEFDRRARETRFFKGDYSRIAGREMTLSLVELHHTHIAPTLRPVDADISIRVDFNSYSIAGKIDLTEENDVLADHKTANRRGKHKVNLRAQSTLYSLLYLHKFGRKASLFRFDSLPKNLKPQHIERIQARVTAHDQVVLQYRIRVALSEMRNSLKTGDWRLAEQDHWRCEATGRWCPYLFKGCPKGKKFSKGVKR